MMWWVNFFTWRTRAFPQIKARPFDLKDSRGHDELHGAAARSATLRGIYVSREDDGGTSDMGAPGEFHRYTKAV